MRISSYVNKDKKNNGEELLMIKRDQSQFLTEYDHGSRSFSLTPSNRISTKIPAISIKNLMKNHESLKKKPELHILYSPTIIKVSNRSRYLIYQKGKSSNQIKLPKIECSSKKISISQFLFSFKPKVGKNRLK